MMDNQRFPHSVVISRVTGAGPLSAGTTTVLYSGKCRNYRNTETFTKEGVLMSEFVISLPTAGVSVCPDDVVSVTDRVRTISGRVVETVVTNFGTNIWWRRVNN